MGLGTALRRFPGSRFFGRMPSTMYVTASESRVLARIFGFEVSTIRTHLKRIFAKLGVHRRSGVAGVLAKHR
jgi:DNA-binding CsgD family transcriptional regulator